jgi:signal transduction histidine kinase
VSILLVRSVIKEVKQRNQLEILNEKLKELDKQKDEFVSMAAHELRSPLTAIKGYVSMVIEGDTGDIPEKARQYLADSMAVTDRLVRLVNNMLNVSRIEEGRIVYQLEETSLIRAVQEIYNSSRVEAERKELEFVVKIPNGLEDNIKVDPDRIREVIGNLVSNAIKFTEKGKVHIAMTNPKPEVVRVEVSDTGPGISQEEQAKLFQKFYRAESTAGKTFGTGLGLYITRLLIEKFGGEMGVISELDKGSNFWFELPVAKRV